MTERAATLAAFAELLCQVKLLKHGPRLQVLVACIEAELLDARDAEPRRKRRPKQLTAIRTAAVRVDEHRAWLETAIQDLRDAIGDGPLGHRWHRPWKGMQPRNGS